jgi:predicted house-cleaning noncanonical NTP pyrophosphatase (MazG superfamily)
MQHTSRAEPVSAQQSADRTTHPHGDVTMAKLGEPGPYQLRLYRHGATEPEHRQLFGNPDTASACLWDDCYLTGSGDATSSRVGWAWGEVVDRRMGDVVDTRILKDRRGEDAAADTGGIGRLMPGQVVLTDEGARPSTQHAVAGGNGSGPADAAGTAVVAQHRGSVPVGVCEACDGQVEPDVEGVICRACRQASLRGAASKLVRDRVPELMGADWRGHVAGDAEYLAALGRKLREEAREAAAEVDAGQPDKLLHELGDVREVADALAAAIGASPAEVERRRQVKRARRGGFARRLIWDGQPLAKAGADEGNLQGGAQRDGDATV